jgi:two-component system NarL family sensor kinase
VEVAAYRITSEALTNAARHAGASRCHVRLRASADGLLVDVQDDGAGLGPAAQSGVGMRSMRERAAELDGGLAVTAAPGGGTLVHAVLPWAGSR